MNARAQDGKPGDTVSLPLPTIRARALPEVAAAWDVAAARELEWKRIAGAAGRAWSMLDDVYEREEMARVGRLLAAALAVVNRMAAPTPMELRAKQARAERLKRRRRTEASHA